jgi:hypothetical protein
MGLLDKMLGRVKKVADDIAGDPRDHEQVAAEARDEGHAEVAAEPANEWAGPEAEATDERSPRDSM